MYSIANLLTFKERTRFCLFTSRHVVVIVVAIVNGHFD